MLSEDSVTTALTHMVSQDHDYKKVMKRAVDILEMEPASQENILTHYVELLLKFKSLDHLTNRVLDAKAESVIDLYNLDVVAFIVVVLLAVGKVVQGIITALYRVLSVRFKLAECNVGLCDGKTKKLLIFWILSDRFSFMT